MPKFTVEKSISIAAPTEDVYPVVRDFRSWPKWSPWLLSEPDCPLDFAEDGSSYSWDGEIIGSGSISVVGEETDRRIDYDLRFLHPWKSQSDVSMEFERKGEATHVTWKMDGSLPPFLFWMKKSMAAFIGMDYERGLSMLRDLVESGEVPSKLEFGRASVKGGPFIGLRSRCSPREIGPAMDRDIKTVDERFRAAGLEPSGVLRSFYHKWDPVKEEAEYTIGYPVKALAAEVPSGLTRIDVPDLDAYTVTHTGKNEHLGNAWSAGVTHGRARKFKQRRGIHPFETYETRPDEGSGSEAVTVVHFPVKPGS